MKFIDLTNQENYVLQVQRMLRDINYYAYDDASLGITGIYDTPTRLSVMSFQRDMGISPSGRVDIETWEALNSTHLTLIEENASPRAVHLFPTRSGYEILPETEEGIIYTLQYMLNEISINDSSQPELIMTGAYDIPTQSAVKSFKRRHLLGNDSILDTRTLNRIFDDYEAVISSDL